MTPEIIDGMSNADYHRHAALGSSSLKTLATKTPAHYKHQLEHRTTSPAFDLGTVVHSITLEEDESGIVVVDADSWRTKAAKEAAEAARAEGKTPLLEADWRQAQAMRDSIQAHPLARIALEGGKAESSIFWEHSSGTALKARPDKWNPEHPKLGNIICDLKTTVDANPREFGRTAAKFGYNQSNALYCDGVEALTGERPSFLFVLVEKQAPFLVSVVELHPDAVDLGARLNERGILIYRSCLETGEWPGYETPEPIQLPRWAEMSMEELTNV